MGANIGTTVTSWLLSLSGIESSNTFVKLLKPESFTPILAVIAIFILMSSKNDRKRSIATILIGFSILMFGMSTMSSSVSSLKDVPEFTQLFVLFSNPIIGMLVGAILTAVIQSSSASVGILQALCATGAITFASTIPIIMGQNIGTCFTAILSSIGTSKNAKRTAMIHLSFNVIGTILFMLLFYSINAIHPFPFLNDPVKPYSIAIVHTIFNILSTILLLPFSNVLVKLAHFLIPTKKGEVEITLDPVEEDLKRLAPHFLEQPGFAVEQAYATMTSMARQSYKAIDMALNLVEDYSDEMFDLVCRQENQIDRYEEALNKYLIQITAAKLNDRDNRKLTIMIHSLHDFERIADHAINIGEQAGKKNDATFEFSKVAMMDFYLFSAALRDIIQRTVEAFSNLDVERAFTIEPLEQRIDDLDQEFNNRHISRLRQGICSAELGIIISDLYNNMERVADHCSNIGECIVQYGNRNFKAYEYDSELYKSHNNFDDITTFLQNMPSIRRWMRH